MGSRVGLNKNQLMCMSDWTQTFSTLEAADRAVTDWQEGKGIWGGVRRPPFWVAVRGEA